MVDSQTGLQLRQRGLGIDVGGLVVQLLGVGILSSSTFGLIAFIPLAFGVAAVVSSFTKVKDTTGTADMASAATAFLGFIAAVDTGDYFAFVMIGIGAAIVYFGNKQLAAGIRS